MPVVTRYKNGKLNIIEIVYTPRETTDPLNINCLIHLLTKRGYQQHTFGYNLKTTKRLASAAKTT